MPPKKSKLAAGFNAADHADTEGQGLDKFALPKSTVTKIAKSVVPDSAKFEKDIPLALVGGSTIFINYLTALAHDIAQEKGQKTITATHVLEAVKQLGWEDEKEVIKALKGELKAHRKNVEDKKNGSAPAKPRAPGARPFGRPPEASTSTSDTTANTTTTTTSASTSKDPSGQSAIEPRMEAEEEVGEDSTMSILKEDTLDSREDEAEAGIEGEEQEQEEEDDEEAYGTNEEDEAEEVGIDEELMEQEEEDRVGDGLEEDQLVQGDDD